MTDSIKLKQKIIESGYRRKYIADMMGLSYYGLQNKVEGRTDFKAREIVRICDLLNIDVNDREAIFFAPDVDSMPTN